MLFSGILKAYLRRIREIHSKEGTKATLPKVFNYLKKEGKKQIRDLPAYLYWRIRYRNSMSLPSKVIYVNPSKINYMQIPQFKRSVFIGYAYIKDGAWDNEIRNLSFLESKNRRKKNERFIIPFDNFYFYESFKEHFNEGLPWKKTRLYQVKLKAIKNGEIKPSKRYGTKEKLENRLKELDELFKKIREQGYKTQKEIKSELEEGNREVLLQQGLLVPSLHEVMVNIARDGKLIFEEGRHRLCIAKILELDSIPVRVLVRHKKWQELREEIANVDSKKELSDRALKHFNHPDMEDVMGKLREN